MFCDHLRTPFAFQEPQKEILFIQSSSTCKRLRLNSILSALREINRATPIVLPLHPRTRSLLEKQGKQHWLDSLLILDPVPYLEMQRLEMGAHAILTDSGGIQKEAYFHQVPCITLRDETEWVETVKMGWNQITGACHKNSEQCHPSGLSIRR